MATVPTVTLNNGVAMPILGFGVFQMADPTECEQAVRDALEVGYRSIDTAAAYANEEAVGRAIAGSGVPRDEIFLTTKLWISDQGEKQAAEAFQRSLDRLGTDYVDLYLIHQPFGDVYGSWRAMEQMYKDGRAKAIGISNFKPDRVMDLIMFNEVAPAVNQIETHPFNQQVETQQFLQENGVQIESWGPFAEGRNDLFTNDVLTGIGQKYGKSVAQIVVRWLTQRGVVAIPKSVRRDRMEENFNVFDFELDRDDMARIAALDTGASLFFDHTDPETVKRLGGAVRNT